VPVDELCVQKIFKIWKICVAFVVSAKRSVRIVVTKHDERKLLFRDDAANQVFALLTARRLAFYSFGMYEINMV